MSRVIRPEESIIGNEEISAHGVASVNHMSNDKEEEIVISNIRATDVAAGLRRLPAGFYVAIQHGDRAWRTENKPVSVVTDVVEWDDLIPLPSDLSGTICLQVYASFEFQPMLGSGEQLRTLSIHVQQLLDHSAKDVPFTFSSDEDDVVSPCSSLSITVRQRKRESGDTSAPRTLLFHESLGELEEATNQGHSALSRYRKHGEKQDLERSIEKFERALDICPLDHPCHATALSNMATAKYIYCWVDDADPYFNLPLILYRTALAARPGGHHDRPSTLIQLAIVYLGRFEEWHDTADAARAEELLHEAVDFSSVNSYEKRAAVVLLRLHAELEVGPDNAGNQSSTEQDSASCVTDEPEDLRCLCLEWLLRFKQTHNLEDLQRGISLLQASTWSYPTLDRAYVDSLANLGMLFSHRFRLVGNPRDVDKAISRFRSAVDLTPDGDPAKPDRLDNLGNAFKDRFEHLGKLDDLEQAISGHRAAVNLTPDGHPDQTCRLGNLANTHLARFLRLGNLKDLEESILRHRTAVDLTPDHHPNKPRRLHNLALSLITRFKRLGDLGDLEQAISTHTGAVELIPDGHPDKPMHMNTLASSFKARFDRLGRLDDLEQALLRYRAALDLIPDEHPGKPAFLNNLANAFGARFEHLGELSDLEQAVSWQRTALDLVPSGHPMKTTCLMNLGISFGVRFKRLGELHDLDQMLSMHKEAVDLTTDDHPAKPSRLNNLGIALFIRFETFNELDDLEQAISRHRDSIVLTLDSHPEKPKYLDNLAMSILARFERLGDLGDIEQAIAGNEECVKLTPNGHPHKARRLSNLGNSYFARYNRFRDQQDLEKAMLRFEDAINLTPDGHPDKPSLLQHLSGALGVRFAHGRGGLSDLEQGISLNSLAASASTGRSTVRFHASQQWILNASTLGHRSLLDAYSTSIDILPLLAWIGLPLERRYRELLQAADVVREAAAAALDAGLPETAVEWLEQGRSIVWGELFQLRSPYEELSSTHPNLANKLQKLSAALEHASSAHERSLSSLSQQSRSVENCATESLEQTADRHRMLAIERDKLLQEIRQLPGFERFLLHKKFSQLRASAHSGPVVILNAAKERCDALIVLAEVDHAIHVPLPNFTLNRAAGLQNMVKSLIGSGRATRVIPDDERDGKRTTRWAISWESLLSTLWNGVVKPILDALDFTPGQLRRIFWCPTGPFAFLPIHAAGLYGTEFSGPGHKASDFVVSSYVPTLSIILSVPKPDITSEPHDHLRLLTVRQPPSDGQPHLPGVETELEHIKTVIKDSSSQATLMESSVGTVEEVLALMREADWVHFACHGIQDAASATESGLCLADRRRLKLTDIIALSRPRGGLAFLSACQTATGDKNLSDEAIHIAAGMLFAGYGGAVGTMWSISDRLAPRVARDVYERLFQNGAMPNYQDAARALHDAVGCLREHNASFVEWLPFIHVGL